MFRTNTLTNYCPVENILKANIENRTKVFPLHILPWRIDYKPVLTTSVRRKQFT